MNLPKANSLHAVNSFGGIDADADSLLEECFTDHPAYHAVLGMDRFLVLGRKGSGKTAIYRRLLAQERPDALTEGYSFEDYPWYHHDLQAETGVPEERRYIHSWKYLILISLSRLLLNSDNSQPWSESAADSMEVIESFVVDSYGKKDPDMAALFNPQVKLRFSGGIGPRFANLKAEQVAMSDLPVHVQDVNRAISNHVFESLNPGIDYYICFDQLDLGFDPNDPAYALRLTGLLLAAKDLRAIARSKDKRFNPAIFLRDDIYQDLKFEDKNKLTENHMVPIRWSEFESELTLKSLMELRFNSVLEDAAWDDIFDEDQEMPSRQTKYQHICDRTFLRPRDMIKFCNEVLRVYKDQSGQGKFDNYCLHAARNSYSQYLLNEMDDEILKHVPSYQQYLDTVKAIGTERFQRIEFEEEFSKRVGESETPSFALEQLFNFSVIGYQKSGGRGGGSGWVWKYKDDRARFDPIAHQYRVHPGFKEALGLIQRSGT